MLPPWIDEGISFFFPRRCPFCDGDQPLEWGVCMDCETTLPWFEPPWCAACGRPLDAGGTLVALCSDCLENRPVYDHGYSVVAYEDTVQQAITRLKYGRDATMGPALGAVLLRLLPATVNPFVYDCVAAVPLHRQRLRWRGFNQALLLAGVVSRKFRLPLRRRLLERIRATPAQAGLDREGRMANLAAAFAVPDRSHVEGKTLLLVDDVMTTGMTLEVCAQALKEAGAKRVDVLTVARALPGRGP
jgi:ComF family protein